jgi:protein required for attachment to host cells
MAGMKIDPGMWVVVCDGRKWLILENAGDAKFPTLKVRESKEQENPATRQQGTDAPPRVHASVGTAHSAIEQTDWHDEAEREFLTGLVRRLNAAAHAGEVAALAVVAAPRALGMMRPHYSERLKSALRGEIGKDLVNVPVHEIEAMLTK